MQPFSQVVKNMMLLVRMTGEHLDHFLAGCTPSVTACPGQSPMEEANVPPVPDEGQVAAGDGGCRQEHATAFGKKSGN